TRRMRKGGRLAALFIWPNRVMARVRSMTHALETSKADGRRKRYSVLGTGLARFANGPVSIPASDARILLHPDRAVRRSAGAHSARSTTLRLYAARHELEGGAAAAVRFAGRQLLQHSGGATRRPTRDVRRGGELLRHALRGARGRGLARNTDRRERRRR